MPTMPRDPRIPDLVSATEAAEILGISRQAVNLRASRGQLLGAQVGTTWVFRRAIVEAARPAPATE
ncbi:DNA-binding protein [Micromonospora sp. KC207]|uniref:helix-turn-helix domain-containing protein n=1 Tax=Micromonospora sp. KC207 TaxID=2530377 RepID=UPI00105062DD|nr:helix-turn-helix domain-containing protein [Micromonospora sp. KC207]TDC63864.1 DNA-binding protein [Micromonospora sp. KC207]